MFRTTSSDNMSKPLPLVTAPVKEGPSSQNVTIGDGEYFLVPRPVLTRAGVDQKSAPTPLPLKEEATTKEETKAKAVVPSAQWMPHIISRRRGKHPLSSKTSDIISVRLIKEISVSSSTGLVLSTVSSLVPASFVDWTSGFNNVFDAARCLGGRVHSHFGANPGGLTVVGTGGADAFDPGNNGARSSVSQALEHRYNSGPISLDSQSSTEGQFPQPMTKNGFITWAFKTLPNIESGYLSDLVGSNWFPTSTTTAIVGFLSPYVENNSTTGNMNLFRYVELDMEFSYRQ